MSADDRPTSPAKLVQNYVCPELRTKTMYLNVEWRRDPDVESNGTAVYWCLKTGIALGPDSLPAVPRACDSRRACCTPPSPPNA
jgi:hypothetical protein